VARIHAVLRRRRGLLTELSEREGVRVFPAAERAPAAARFEPPLIDLVRTQIRSELGDATRVVLDRSRSRALWISLDI
jgi:hypothetical protein